MKNIGKLSRFIKPHFLFFFISFLLLFSAIYYSFSGNPFVMDDEVQIVGNSAIQSWEEWGRFWSSSTMDSGGTEKLKGIYYKPLMTSYFSLIWNLFGSNPAAFRWPLWLMHVSSASLISVLAGIWFPLSYAFLWGLLFLIHPLNSEVIFYIADAQDIMYFFFGLSALYFIHLKKRNIINYVTILIVLAGAIFSKETGILFLLLAPLFAYFFNKEKWRIMIIQTLGLSALYVFLRMKSGLTHFQMGWQYISNANFGERLKLFPWILGHYFENFFFPLRLSLSHDVRSDFIPFNQYILSCIILVLGLATLIWAFKKSFLKHKNLSLFFAATLTLWLALHSNLIVPLDGVYTDRWFYLASWPMIGLYLFAFSTFEMTEKWKHSKPTLGVLIILAFGLRDFYRGQDWVDPLQLYQREADLHPWDALMQNNVGVELFRRGDFMGGLGYFMKSTELNSQWEVSWNNLGAAYEKKGEYEKSLECYAKSISLGTYAMAYENYGYLLLRMGRRQEAQDFIKKYLPSFPMNQNLQRLQIILNN